MATHRFIGSNDLHKISYEKKCDIEYLLERRGMWDGVFVSEHQNIKAGVLLLFSYLI